MTENKIALDVWLRFDAPDDEESSAEANTYEDGDLFRVEWYLTSVGLVKSVSFATYPEATAWLTKEGFTDYSSQPAERTVTQEWVPDEDGNWSWKRKNTEDIRS